MSTVTDSDLQEVKDLINRLDRKIDVNQARTDENLNGLKISQGEMKMQLTSIDNRLIRVETKLETLEPSIQKIPDLSEKVGELKNWRQIALIIVGSVLTGGIGGVIGWLIRGGR